MDTAFAVAVRNALTSFIGRIVLALYTLLVVPLMPSIINFTNNVLGYDLTDAQITSYANKASLAVGGLAAIWLINSGLFERAALIAKSALTQLNAGDPTVPPDEGGEVKPAGWNH